MGNERLEHYHYSSTNLSLGLNKSGVIVGFYIGTAFGNSIFMNNAFYTGKNGVAGELKLQV